MTALRRFSPKALFWYIFVLLLALSIAALAVSYASSWQPLRSENSQVKQGNQAMLAKDYKKHSATTTRQLKNYRRTMRCI
ncbi:MAG: hypothetical protein IPJ88_14845 [Myxococcales bacterium]|nr:MAG: hypothetical protein IPJ88_14845 [Myxococcales bacterium]